MVPFRLVLPFQPIPSNPAIQLYPPTQLLLTTTTTAAITTTLS